MLKINEKACTSQGKNSYKLPIENLVLLHKYNTKLCKYYAADAIYCFNACDHQCDCRCRCRGPVVSSIPRSRSGLFGQPAVPYGPSDSNQRYELALRIGDRATSRRPCARGVPPG